MNRSRFKMYIDPEDTRWRLFDEVLTIAVASKKYSWSKTAIQGWCNEGKIIAEKQGKVWLICRSSLEDWIEIYGQMQM